MTRADRVHSTPPLSTSLSNSSETATLAVNSRRRFLSQAAAVTAGGAVRTDRPRPLRKPLIRS
jgi:hypothetical protein